MENNQDQENSQVDSQFSSSSIANEEEIALALAKIDNSEDKKDDVEKPSWISRSMTLFATVVFGSPESYGMKPSFYNLPFERAHDQTPERPGEYNIEWVRENIYINDFRRRMLDGFAWPVAFIILIFTVIVPGTIHKFESWNEQRMIASAQENREKAQSILTGLGQPSLSSCEQVLSTYNDFLADVLASQKSGKPGPEAHKMSPKKQAYVAFGQRCQNSFYTETQNAKKPLKMVANAPANQPNQ